MEKKRQGFIHVYTGNGKGKTTAALGAAMRALGHRYKILMIQFMKGRAYGELLTAKSLKNFKIVQSGTDEFIYKGNLKKKDIDLARRGLKLAESAIKSNRYDMIILDELNVALYFGLIPLTKVIKLINQKPKSLELIITGRNAPDEILRYADLVTEMKEIKHYYQKGIECRKGIEW